MSRQYYTLALFEDGYWSPDFGDYDKDVVQQERLDRADSGTLKKNMKVIATKPDQASIMSAISHMNRKSRP